MREARLCSERRAFEEYVDHGFSGAKGRGPAPIPPGDVNILCNSFGSLKTATPDFEGMVLSEVHDSSDLYGVIAA